MSKYDDLRKDVKRILNHPSFSKGDAISVMELIEELIDLKESYEEALNLISYFTGRVEEGTIRSKTTYAMYKEFLKRKGVE